MDLTMVFRGVVRGFARVAAGVFAAAWVGCASQPAAHAEVRPAEAGAAPQVDFVAQWLAAAERPEAVACTVDAADAPEAVARFRELSARIATLYRSVYDQAQEAAPAWVAVDAEARRSAQAAVTARYQATMAEIAAAREDLAAYTEALREDESISNMTERLRRTRVLTAFGGDSTRLDAQLRDAEHGAALMLRRGLAATRGR